MDRGRYFGLPEDAEGLEEAEQLENAEGLHNAHNLFQVGQVGRWYEAEQTPGAKLEAKKLKSKLGAKKVTLGWEIGLSGQGLRSCANGWAQIWVTEQ